MASMASRQEKHSNTPELSLPRQAAAGMAKTYEPVEASSPNFDAQGVALQRAERSGHSYQGGIASDNATVHNGDIHAQNITYNYASRTEQATIEKDRVKAFLTSLAFERMDHRLATIHPAYGKTCQWLFTAPQYLRWLASTSPQSSHNKLLWIKGKAGAGKSTIMKSIFESASNQMPGAHVIPFFFNARGEALERSVEGMFRSLLLEVLEKVPVLQKIIPIPRSLTR